jgi:hypothetical protein
LQRSVCCVAGNSYRRTITRSFGPSAESAVIAAAG